MTARALPLPAEAPHSVQAEQALLGALFLNNDAMGFVSGILEPEHFHEEIHERIFRVVVNEIQHGRKATPVSVLNMLPSEAAPGIGMSHYVAQLFGEATSVLNAPDYARTIRDHAVMRSILRVGDELMASRDRGIPPDEALQLAFDGMDAIRGALAGNEVHRGLIGDLALRVLEQDTGFAVPTTLTDFDVMIGGGLRTGRLYVMGGRPGMGKTVWMCTVSRRLARAGTGVSIFSLETDNREIAARMIADELARTDWPVPYRCILANQLNGAEYERVAKGAQALDGFPILIDETPGLTIADIEARARMDRDRFGKQNIALRVVMIDYLGLIRRGDRYRGRTVDEIGEITLAAKGMSKRLNVAVVMFAQLNRSVESRDDKRPGMADLRDSGNIEQDADVVAMLYRPQYYIERSVEYRNKTAEADAQFAAAANKLEMIIGKNRLGPAATIDLWCEPQFSAIDNWARF